MPLTDPQQQIVDGKTRFKVIATGRRFGKTTVLSRRCCEIAAQQDKNVAYIAPNYKMAKRIVWKKLKAKLHQLNWLDGKPHETDLIFSLKSGSTIQLFGAENYDAMRGLEFDHVACDEFAFWSPEAWDEVIRPTLSNKLGTADFASSPDGRNHFYDFYGRGLSGEAKWADWSSFHYTTAQGGLVLPEELESARYELDELTFLQEYEASFVNFTGRVYYSFSEQNYGKLVYDPEDDLVFCFDFNVSPGIAVVIQEQYLPSPSGKFGTGIIDEVYIPQNSNTKYVCEKLISKYQAHKGRVLAYGDSTGGNKVASSLVGSDWDIINSLLSVAFQGGYQQRVARSNPLERARINSVNSRIKSFVGNINLMVDPNKAPYCLKDFEGTKILEGSNGRIDKSKGGDNSKFSHMTDAIGYYIHYEFSGERRVTSTPFYI